MSLRPHQLAGSKWLQATPGGYLADAPRVQKTRTLLHATLGHPTLAVCPAIVRDHWRSEAAAVGHGQLYIESYDEARRGGLKDMKTMIEQFKISRLLLDEAHLLKHPSAQRTRVLLGRDGYARRMCTYFASGTPFAKSPADLWTWLSSMHPGVLINAGFRTKDQFESHFAVMRYSGVRNGEARYKAVEVKNEDQLKALLAPIMLRRTLADLGHTQPPLDWQVMELTRERGAAAYTGEAKKVMAAIENGSLAQIENDPAIARIRRRIGVEVKTPLAIEYIIGLNTEDPQPIVIFAYHTEVLELLYETLRHYGRVMPPITGSMPAARQQEVIREFQAGNSEWILCQQGMTQMGIRLDRADTALFVEPDWTANVNVQAGMRVVDADRPNRKCVGVFLTLANSLDDAIVRQNHRETEMQSKLL